MEFGATEDERNLLVINDLKFWKSVVPMTLVHVKKIETHFSSSNCALHPNLKELIVDLYEDWGTTPLILACRQGELDSVKHLVEIWGVDVRAPANYYSNPPDYYFWSVKIQSVTPLFVAAFHGHNQVVRYLLEKGADAYAKIPPGLNYTSKFDGWIPLYGALSDVHFDPTRPLLQQQEERHVVVRSLLEFGANPITYSFKHSDGEPIWSGMMCGANAIIALINHGLDLTYRIPFTGETILNYVIGLPHGFSEEDSLAIVKLLGERGADLLTKDKKGVSPLMKVADRSDRIFLFVDGGIHSRLNLAVLDLLLERDEYGPMEKIEAMEFAGATILFDAKYAPFIPKAFEYWRRAHQLRETEKQTSGSSADKILGRKIGTHVEWTTLTELDKIMENPEEYKVQSLLVKLRILSGRNSHAEYKYRFKHYSLSSLYMNKLRESAVLDSIEESIQCLDINWVTLDLVIRRLDPLSTSEGLWIQIEEYIRELVGTFKTYPSLINFERIKTSLDLILQATDSSPITVTNGEHVTDESYLRLRGTHFTPSLLNLLEMIFRLPGIPNEHNMDLLNQSLRQLGPRRLGNLLLPACKNVYKFNNLALVRVLLEAGADPNVAVDADAGNTSLHVAAGFHDQELCEATGTLLLEHGAHLDRVNKAGQTAVDVWIETWNRTRAATRWDSRPNWCRAVPKLLCLSARCVRINNLPYTDGKTPIILHSLIELR